MTHTFRTRITGSAITAIALLVSGCATPQAGCITRYGAIPPGAYAVVAEVRAKPGKADELRAATIPLVENVRNEPKNLLYFLHEDRQEPGHFVFYEIFADQESFEAHNATDHVQAWFAKLPGLADGGVEVIRMRILND